MNSWCENCQRCDCCEVLVCGGTLYRAGGDGPNAGDFYCWWCWLVVVLAP